jgi:hypothetical protein
MVLFQNCAFYSKDVTLAEINAANSKKYFQATSKVVVDVYYEPGAEPFTGSSPQGSYYWDTLEQNIGALFQYRNIQPLVMVPKELSAMQSLPPQLRNEWNGIDILKLNATQFLESPANESHFQVYFLNGYYSNGSGPQPNVIGLSLSGTSVIAMFKQVVNRAGHSSPGQVSKFVEQSTLVHEFGHSMGFVNNGVPVTLDYQDANHGSHSTNPDCVMYWENEGADENSSFVQKHMNASSKILWGPEVLNDAKSLSQ